ELLISSIELPVARMGFRGPDKWLRSSALKTGGAAWQRLISITQAVGGTRYVTAHGAANYLDHEAFERAGIAVDYMDYSKTPYPQLYGRCTPYVSILDLIANLGMAAQTAIRPKTISWRNFLSAKTR